MRIRHLLAVAVFAAGIGGLIVPALAQMHDGAGNAPNQGMSRMEGSGHMGHGTMPGGMMAGGCAGMMQSMNGGGGRPNSQWRSGLRGGGMSE
ncbi:MAG: hypothetical protein J0H14_26705 [Alphaproteobacteria bacterium]|nr:hypothetical protein [Alphaproteobacteria bacterium]